MTTLGPSPTVVAARARLVTIPLTRPWGPDVTGLRVIVVSVRDSMGAEGHGFSWTPTIGARAVQAMLDEHLLPRAIGGPADPAIWDDEWRHVHEAGSGGVTTIALAGLDLALWDLAATRSETGVPELLGRRHERLATYGSGVNLHYPLEDLVAQARRWTAAGHTAVKVKVGKPDLEEDLERVTAVREAIGPSVGLMIDANQRWDLMRAARAADVLEPLGIDWLEEPLRADDLPGHAELRRRTSIPIALGENLHTWYRFRDFLDAEAVDIVQPNIVRVGGITPFLRIADLARERGVRLTPHLLPELSAQVAFALPEPTIVEDVEDARFEQLDALDRTSGVVFDSGWASGGPRRGLGIRFRPVPGESE